MMISCILSQVNARYVYILMIFIFMGVCFLDIIYCMDKQEGHLKSSSQKKTELYAHPHLRFSSIRLTSFWLNHLLWLIICC
jgi:hypothetical protein